VGDVSDLTAVSASEMLVGISVSEPDDEELVRLGLSELHVRHAFVEIVRHVLAAGWSVAYGGDFRARGYTETMLDLVRTYERTTLRGPEQVICYLAWPRWTDLTDADRAELANIATLVQVPAPEGAPATLDPDSADDRVWNAAALTCMRNRVTVDLGASVVVGGRVAGQQGLLPGVIEEAVIALAAGVPLFVAGGFGGCGHLIARVINGETPEELSVEFQRDHTEGYAALYDAAARRGAAPDYGAAIAEIFRSGLGGLRNGLDDEDNRKLLATDDIDELIALVLRGLFTLAGDRNR
jgi:hypothetical protein